MSIRTTFEESRHNSSIPYSLFTSSCLEFAKDVSSLAAQYVLIAHVPAIV